MHLLYPIGLLAFAGLIVPLVIHLWNVKQGKTLKIGSIALLGESSRASSKSFRINDWLLFILRCLLLIFITIILAQPYLKKVLKSKNNGGWVLVNESDFPKILKANRKTIDSLIKAGYEIHDFNIGFKQLLPHDTLANQSVKTINQLTYTDLLQQLNDEIPTGFKVYLYADRHLKNFGENLPKLNYHLIWRTTAQTDTSGSWIATFADQKYEAKSNSNTTTYKPLNSVNAPALSVFIYAADNNTDSKYIRAALSSIGNFTGRELIVQNWNNHTMGKADLGFWLSENAVNQAFKASINLEGSLFNYENGKVIAEKSFIKFANSETETIDLSKRIEEKNDAEKIWADGFGHAILTKEKVDHLNLFHFYSRLNPQWTELVWNAQFVKALLPIVIKDEKFEDFGFENNPADRRIMANNQKDFIQVGTKEKTEIKTLNQTLNYFFWIIALLIFVVERILSFSKKPKTVYVKN